MNFGTPESARAALRVSYLTSSSFSASLSCIHFYQVVEQTQGTTRPQKRCLILVDRPTYQCEMDTAINRCVMMSKIEEMMVMDDHLRPLTGPFCEYDVLLQQCSMLDFVRTIGAIYKPNNTLTVNIPLYELEENQPITGRVNVRLNSNALKDVPGSTLSEVAIKTLQESNTREVQALKEALQRQKDEQLMELVDLHTQNESLKHSLSQTEQYMMAVKRTHKEEREQLLSRVADLEAQMRRFQTMPNQVPYPYPQVGPTTNVSPSRHLPATTPPPMSYGGPQPIAPPPGYAPTPSPSRSNEIMDKLERDLRFGSDYLTRLHMKSNGTDPVGMYGGGGAPNTNTYGGGGRPYPQMDPQYINPGQPSIRNVQFASPSGGGGGGGGAIGSPRSPRRLDNMLTRPSWK